MTAPRRADAIIAGGGLHGLSAAIHLAEAGLDVVLLERDRVGRHASGANAGGVRRLGRDLPELPLAVEALARWASIADWLGDDCGFRPSHQIKVAETEAELARLEERAGMLRAAGFEHEEIIGRNALNTLLPDVARHCPGGMIVRGDGHADPLRTVRRFHDKARALGVAIHEGRPVEAIEHAAGRWRATTPHGTFEAPYLVNAAGAWGGALAAMMGEPVPLEAQALMLMITERLRPFLSPVVGAQGRALSFKQFENGTVLIGGAYRGRIEAGTGATWLDPAGLAANAAAAAADFPLIAQARIARGWAGIEGVTPDHLPIIGPAARAGGVHLFGFSAHGFALAPVGGRIAAELILTGQSSLPIRAFSVGRFAPVPG